MQFFGVDGFYIDELRDHRAFWKNSERTLQMIGLKDASTQGIRISVCVILLGLNLYLFGIIAGLAIWIVEMIWIPFWAAGVINGVGHFAGYRNFDLPDASRNIVPWGLLIGGEELHNNHHAYASSAQFSARGWEIDLGWWYVRLLSAMRLLKVHRKIPMSLPIIQASIPATQKPSKHLYRTVFKFCLTMFREVIDDVCREEIRSASGDTKKLLKKAKRLLDAERSMLSEKNQERLRHFLATNKRLQKVYLMKEIAAQHCNQIIAFLRNDAQFSG